MLIYICIIIIIIIVTTAIIGSTKLISREEKETYAAEPTYKPSKFRVPSIIVGWSDDKGRGVFANKDFKKGVVIEYAPVLEIDLKTATHLGLLNDYVFSHHSDPDKSILPLGYVSLYNHDDNNNVAYHYDESNQWFVTRATRNIHKGEELCITYGSQWWIDRPHLVKK